MDDEISPETSKFPAETVRLPVETVAPNVKEGDVVGAYVDNDERDSIVA